MKFTAIITTRTGEKITLCLNCREYHANKLNYVFSRTLDRAIYAGAEIIAGECSTIAAPVAQEIKPPRAKIPGTRQIENGGK